MNRAHIAIVSTPVPCQVIPTFSIVRSLVRRGYRVTYVTSSRFASRIRTLGAEVLPCPRMHTVIGPTEEQYASSNNELAEITLRLVTAFYEKNPPDLIIHDIYAFAGQVLAQRLGITAIRTNITLAFDEQSLKHEVVPTEVRQLVLDFSNKADEFFHSQGITRSNILHDRRQRTIYFYPRDFQLSQHEGDEQSLYASRCAVEQPYEPGWRGNVADGGKVGLVTASTYYLQGVQYYKMCAAVLSELGMHSVLAIGENNDAASFGSLPPHCEIVQGVPQVALMPHADLMIFSGGMSASLEALYHGLPLIVVTHGEPECEMYADNLRRHGLCVHLKTANPTAESLKRSIVQVLADTALHEEVRRRQYSLRRSPGGEEVVNWIEDCMSSVAAERNGRTAGQGSERLRFS